MSDAPPSVTHVLMNLFLLNGSHAVPRACMSPQEPHSDVCPATCACVLAAAAVCPPFAPVVVRDPRNVTGVGIVDGEGVVERALVPGEAVVEMVFEL